MTVIEKNIEIAKMLGLKRIKDWQGVECFTNPNWYHLQWSNKYQDNLEIETYRDSELCYHSDANWQFEVISYIESLPFFVIISSTGCTIKCWEDSIPLEWLKYFSKYPFKDIFTFGGKNYKLSKKEAIFETLFELSQYLKNKL